MIAEMSAVLSAIMACISAYFSMMAATVNVRHWRHIKRRKHDLIFVVSPAYSTWNFAKIQADMAGVLPDEYGRLFPVSKDSDTQKLLSALRFSFEIVDAEPVLFGDLDKSMRIKEARNWFMITKWFLVVDYTYRGRKRLRRESKVRV